MAEPRRDPRVVSAVMRRVRSAHTAPEMALRRELHRRGLRYRVHDARLPGKPDLVFRSARVVVFVDGDFWHGRQWKQRGHPDLASQFTHNREYWVTKISRTIARDAGIRRELIAAGWDVVRIWETDLHEDLRGWADKVEARVRRARSVA